MYTVLVEVPNSFLSVQCQFNVKLLHVKRLSLANGPTITIGSRLTYGSALNVSRHPNLHGNVAHLYKMKFKSNRVDVGDCSSCISVDVGGVT